LATFKGIDQGFRFGLTGMETGHVAEFPGHTVDAGAWSSLAPRNPGSVGEVVAETGDLVALHPKNKKPIGIRHAYLALKQTYGKDIVAAGPSFRKQTIDGNQIVLYFDSVGSGMVPGKPGMLDAFAIAGADRKWQWADAVIKGDTVIVSSPKSFQARCRALRLGDEPLAAQPALQQGRHSRLPLPYRRVGSV
jgi:hypothetical protein